MWHASFIWDTWLTHIRHTIEKLVVPHHVWYDVWHNMLMCDRTHLYLTWHICLCATWLIHMRRDPLIWDETHSYATHL